MKILVVTPDYPTKAEPVPGVFVQHTMRALAREGHDVAIIHFTRARKSSITRPRSESHNYDVIQNESVSHCQLFWPRWKPFGAWEPFILSRTIARHAGRRIGSLAERTVFAQWLLPSTEAAGYLARRHRLPLAGIARGSDLQNLHAENRHERLARTLRHLPTLLANGEWARAELNSHGFESDARRLLVTRNIRILPKPDRQRKPWRQGDALKIVCTGRLIALKGIDTVLQALARVSLPFTLSVFGHGPELQRLQTLSETLGIGQSTHWLGRQPNQVVLDAIRSSDLFILTSRSEGVPNAVLEALALAAPTIASDVGGIPELIQDGVTGFLVPAGSPDAIAAALSRVYHDPCTALQIGLNGMAHANRLYNYQTCLSILCSALQATLPVTSHRST